MGSVKCYAGSAVSDNLLLFQRTLALGTLSGFGGRVRGPAVWRLSPWVACPLAHWLARSRGAGLGRPHNRGLWAVRGWGGAGRKLSLSPGTQRCSAVSCGLLPRLSHSPGSDRPTRRCCQEEAPSATSSPRSAMLGIGPTEVVSPCRPWLHRGCDEEQGHG